MDVADRWTTRSALVRAAVLLGAAALILAVMLGLGLLVTIPLSTIASTYAYRVVSGGAVAP